MSKLLEVPPAPSVQIHNSLCMPKCTLESVRPDTSDNCRKLLTFEEAIEEHNDHLRKESEGQQRIVEPREALAARSWMAIRDSVAGRQNHSGCAILNAAKGSVGKQTEKFACGRNGEISPLLGLIGWATKNREKDLMALGYEEGDEESRAFFDNM